MATLQVRLQDLSTRIATECKAIRTLLNGNAANLNALTTAAKGNLVAALNEVHALVAGIQPGASINDSSTSSTSSTWSVAKIVEELADTAAAVKTEILGGAGAAYDTLMELQAFIQGQAGDLSSVLTALGNRLRFDAVQALTTAQKAQANANLGAASLANTGDLDTNLVAVFETGLT